MIRVHGLRKHFRVFSRPPGLAAAVRSLFRRRDEEIKAVNGIDFEIQVGERVGFLGPNGAGKTTTLKMLAGLLHPSAGEVHVGEHVPSRRDDAFLQQIMLVMGQKQQLLWDLPPAETFELNRAIYGVSRADFKRTLDELVGLLELGALIGRPARQLSLGERMKCELAAALIHSPRVLFLDEPTIGLDVSMQVTIRAFIKQYNERHQATVMLTSHYMDDVAALCPRVLVIDHGQLTYDGPLDALVQRVRPEKRVVLRLSGPVAPAALSALGGKVVAHDLASVVLQVSTSEVNATIARALGMLPVQDLTVENAPLEEVMSEFFRSAARAPETGEAPPPKPAAASAG